MNINGAIRQYPWTSGFVTFLALGYLAGWMFLGSPVNQPIRYNHSVHIGNGMTCVDCHVGAREQARATLPTLETCMMCHSEPLTDKPEEQKIRTLAEAGQPLVWTQLTRVPRHVYFSHRRHATIGKIECQVCHGPMDTLTEPPRRVFRAMTMEACQNCHAQNNARNDCTDCHR